MPPSASHNQKGHPEEVPDYTDQSRLTEGPELLDELPEISIGTMLPGQGSKIVVLRLIVGVDGKVAYLQVLKSSLPHNIEEQIVRAFFQANYRPGRIGARPVNSEMILSVQLE